MCSAPPRLLNIIREMTPCIAGITNLLDDILVIGYGHAAQEGKLDAVLNTLSKGDATLIMRTESLPSKEYISQASQSIIPAYAACNRTAMPYSKLQHGPL